jgi:hypothetical protein
MLLSSSIGSEAGSGLCAFSVNSETLRSKIRMTAFATVLPTIDILQLAYSAEKLRVQICPEIQKVTVRKTITLTRQQDDWIKSPVEGGYSYTAGTGTANTVVAAVAEADSADREPRQGY